MNAITGTSLDMRSVEIQIDDAPLGDAHTSDGEPRANVQIDQIDLSHDALATELGQRTFDANARHVATLPKWLFWKGTRWEKDEKLYHMTLIRKFLRERASELLTWAARDALEMDKSDAKKFLNWAKREAQTLRSKNTVAAVESLARANGPSVASPDQFDGDRLLLGTPGGTVDLRTGKMRPANRADMITKLTAVAPKSGTPELWLQFLSEIFDGDEELIAFLQRAAGYALTGETREHKMLFLYGTGRNGKSVFLNTLFHIWGDYARRAHAATFVNSNGDKHPTDVAGLQGARLVAGSELPKGKTWDESVIKDLTGGDIMTARFMRGDFFDFDPHLTLMIAGNNMPSFRGVDEAIRARVVLVPFTVTIPAEKRDQKLPEKLMAEAPQILAWAIEGALQWQKRGLDVPASVKAASTEYFDDEDTTGQFIADEVERDATGFVTTTDLHRRFVQWCDGQGLNSWTLRTLQKEIKGRGFQTTRRNTGAGFLGLRLK
jgi:putative DNA primase/helicase